jgi:hypothetical protein
MLIKKEFQGSRRIGGEGFPETGDEVDAEG